MHVTDFCNLKPAGRSVREGGGEPKLVAWVLTTALLAPLHVGCMGVYAEGWANVTPKTSYEAGEPSAIPIKPVEGMGTTLGATAGVNFDFNRGGGLFLGYSESHTRVGDASGNGSGSELRGDFEIVSLSDDTNLRLGGGVLLPRSGSLTAPTDPSAPRANPNGSQPLGPLPDETKGGSAPGALEAGVGLTHFFRPYLEAHGHVGAVYQLQQTPSDGAASGPGVQLRVGISVFPKSGPSNSTVIIPTDSSEDLMAHIRLGAISLGCTAARGEYRESGGGLLMTEATGTCRGVAYAWRQLPKAMVIKCEAASHETCEQMARDVLKETERLLRIKAKGTKSAAEGGKP